MRALADTEACLAVMPLVVAGMEIDAARCAAALTPEVYATARALERVKRGVPFREAYREAARELQSPPAPRIDASGADEPKPTMEE